MRQPGPFLLFLFSLPQLAFAQVDAGEIQFAGRTWRVLGENVKLESYLGQEAVRFRNGAIALPELEFENGTIEFDVATSGHRSFIGCAFRVDLARGSYEDFYLRPHNTGRFDAMQYTPVNNGVSAWQLYPSITEPWRSLGSAGSTSAWSSPARGSPCISTALASPPWSSMT